MVVRGLSISAAWLQGHAAAAQELESSAPSEGAAAVCRDEGGGGRLTAAYAAVEEGEGDLSPVSVCYSTNGSSYTSNNSLNNNSNASNDASVVIVGEASFQALQTSSFFAGREAPSAAAAAAVAALQETEGGLSGCFESKGLAAETHVEQDGGSSYVELEDVALAVKTVTPGFSLAYQHGSPPLAAAAATRSCKKDADGEEAAATAATALEDAEEGDAVDEELGTLGSISVSRRSLDTASSEGQRSDSISSELKTAPQVKDKSGYFATGVIILKSFVGGAFLFLPHAVVKAGLLLSILTLVCVFVLAVYCMTLLVRCCEASERRDAKAASERCRKERGRRDSCSMCSGAVDRGGSPSSRSSPFSDSGEEEEEKGSGGSSEQQKREGGGGGRYESTAYGFRRLLCPPPQRFLPVRSSRKCSSSSSSNSTRTGGGASVCSKSQGEEKGRQGSPAMSSYREEDRMGVETACGEKGGEMRTHDSTWIVHSQAVDGKSHTSGEQIAEESKKAAWTTAVEQMHQAVGEDGEAKRGERGNKEGTAEREAFTQQQPRQQDGDAENGVCRLQQQVVVVVEHAAQVGGAAPGEAAEADNAAAGSSRAAAEGGDEEAEGDFALTAGVGNRGEEEEEEVLASLAAVVVEAAAAEVAAAAVSVKETTSQAMLCSYEGVARAACGMWGERLIEACVVLSQLAFATVNAVIVAGNVRDVVWTAADCAPAYNWSLRAIIWCASLLYVPLCMLKRMKHLVPLALVANVGTAVGVVLLLVAVSLQLVKQEQQQPGQPAALALAHWNSWPLILGTSVYLWEGAGLVLPIRQEAKQKVQQRFSEFFSGSLGCLLLLYVGYSLMCCFAFRENLQVIILFNLSSGAMSLAVQTIFALAVLATYPLMMFPALCIVEKHLLRRSCVKRMQSPLKTNLLVYGTRAALALLTLGVATLGMRQLDDFVALIGGLCGAPLVFVFPVFFHMQLVEESVPRKIFHCCVIAIGLSIQCFSVYWSVASWKGGSDFAARCSAASPVPHPAR